MSRWYDERPRLGKRLDIFKQMEPESREPILNDIISLVKEYQPSLMSDEEAFDFHLNLTQVRWYEKDPFCWYVFSILERADETVLEAVEDYLEKRIRLVI